MTYIFDQETNRRHTHCVKWDEMSRYYDRNDLLPMWVADMDFETAPEIVEALKNRVEQGIFGYVSTPPGYYETAAAWTHRQFGHAVSAETLVHSPGVVPSLSILVRLLTARNEKVIIQPPIYPPFRNVLTQNHRQPLLNPLIEENGVYRMDYVHLEQLASDPDVHWMIFCNPHNPVGRSWTPEELKQLADICLRHDVRILSDEIWRDLVFAPHRHTPLASLSPEIEAITITLFAASKTFNLAGLQASFIAFPREEEKALFQKEMETLDFTRQNTLALTGTQAAYEQGEPWMEALKAYLQENIRFATDYLTRHVPEIHFSEPEATYLLWLDFKALNLPSRELATLLAEKGGVALNVGASFGEEGRGFMRMNVACPRHQVEKALQGIEAAVRSMRGDV